MRSWVSRPKVAFVCVHNSCRSQIAEALGRILACEVFESFSAGSETKLEINADAVRAVRALYGVDMTRTQRSKLLSEFPSVDIVVTMGCNVSCPMIPCRHHEDWGLEDPTGKDEQVLLALIEQIKANICLLKNEFNKERFNPDFSLSPK